MEKLLRNVAIAACLITIGQNAAKAQDFSVTTERNYMGGYTSTYRQLDKIDGRSLVVDVDLRGIVVLPNECDKNGQGPAFEIVNRAPGEPQCIGRR